MNVLILDNNVSNLSSAKEALGEKVETYEIDVSKMEDWEKVKKIVGDKYGMRIMSSPIPISSSVPCDNTRTDLWGGRWQG